MLLPADPGAPQVTAPKLSDRLTEEEPEKMEALRRVFGAFASFGSRQVRSAGGAMTASGLGGGADFK